MSDQRANFKPHWFGEYELLKPLGVGGMAEVYLARTVRSKGFQKIVVVKRLLPQYAPDPHYVQMFIQEAKLTVQLQHANIVQIFSLEEHAGQPFIAMEYVHGKDLLRVLGRAREKNADLPIEFSVHCIAEMLKGLGYAHNASGPHGPLNLVHRDVTPSNIFISFEGDVKLGDFGVAHCVDSSQAKRVLGKLSYLAPEVIAGDRADARSDIYGAGVVLWETLALRPLFRANHEGELIMQILNRTPGPPSAHNARVPHDLDAIAARALAKQPADRFPSAQAFEEALSDYLFARHIRWTRRRVSEVISALFPADCKPLELPPPSPRAPLPVDVDLLAFQDNTTKPMRSPRASPGEIPPPPPTDFSEVTPWSESIELHLKDLVIDDTVKVALLAQESDADRFYVARRGRAEPTPATVDQLIDLLSAAPADVTGVSLFAKPRVDLALLSRLLYWDALVGLTEPDTSPTVARSFDEIGITQLLYQISMRRVSGLVVIESEPERRRRFIYLEQGIPQYIASDDARDGVLPVMRQNALLGTQNLGDLLERVLAEQISLDWALMSSSLREEAEKVEHVFSATIRLRLFAAFAWRHGQFRIYPNAAPPVLLAVRIPPLVDVLVDAVLHAIPPEIIRQRLAPHEQKPVRVEKHSLPHLAALHLKGDEKAVADLIDGKRTLAAIVKRRASRSVDGEETALAVFYVLAETRIARFG